MKNQIPCILEGETGTAKTFSTIILTKYLSKVLKRENIHENFDLIRFNLSSETKTSDLLGKYVGVQNSFEGIKFQEGPFIKAFSEGHCLLLDEINLSSSSLLQCIEEALDTKILSIEVPGLKLKTYNMHKNFCLIATQNPNKGNFIKKRNDLKNKFLSRFQIITFKEFSEKELLEICEKMMTKEKYIENENVIKDLIKFHLEWNKKSIAKNDIIYYTLREINLFIQALSDPDNILTPYEIIMIIYGSKYPENDLDELKNTLKEYTNINEDNILHDKKNEIDNDKKELEFENCQENKSLLRACKSIDFAFKYGKNVIILGNQGVGKTQLSLWIANKYDMINNIDLDENGNKDIYLCICNEMLKCSDLIGKQKPVDNFNNSDGKLIEWEDGFVVKGVLKGKCIILDNIEKALPTVTERLNSLLFLIIFLIKNISKYQKIPKILIIKIIRLELK